MATNPQDIRELRPEQREAAEKLLGRSLVNFQKMGVTVIQGGSDIVVRFFGVKKKFDVKPKKETMQPEGSWDIPTCFNVLTDLTDEERADYDHALSQPVKLSRHL